MCSLPTVRSRAVGQRPDDSGLPQRKVAFFPCPFYHGAVHIQGELTEQEIAYLLERFRQMATLLTGDPAATAECSYCHGEVELGEALLTANLSGVLAHLRCPEDLLDQVLEHAKPDPAFDMEGFVAALEERMAREGPKECSGEIIVEWSGKGDKPGEDSEAVSDGESSSR